MQGQKKLRDIKSEDLKSKCTTGNLLSCLLHLAVLGYIGKLEFNSTTGAMFKPYS